MMINCTCCSCSSAGPLLSLLLLLLLPATYWCGGVTCGPCSSGTPPSSACGVNCLRTMSFIVPTSC